MQIKELIKEYAILLRTTYASKLVPTDELGYWNFNVVFTNNGCTDETQFDIKPCDFDYGAGKCSELEELWRDFCKENGLKQNSIKEVYLANIN